MEQKIPIRRGVSAALAAAQAQSALAMPVRFPGEDGGRSLAEMAQRDLDAALQLLADRAQYITGASGAAIALRRDGRNDMLCRASAGSNAPELGALLSTEFGLSGESVRTRQALRCDDAERDARVNREVCRQLGIASVVVMPVVNDDQVLGVFELFSGKTNAFGERDLSAVQRLSEMVETAVRLAYAAQSLPEQLKSAESALLAASAEVQEAEFVSDLIVEDIANGGPKQEQAPSTTASVEAARGDGPKATASEPAPAAAIEKKPEIAAEAVPAKKALFWSAALSPEAEAAKAAEAEDSHVPPVLRSLKKCVACGFPVSAGRLLCVECEEKKWRGQLRSPSAAGKTGGISAVPSKSAALKQPASAPSGNTFAAAAPSLARTPFGDPKPASETALPAPPAESKEGLRQPGQSGAGLKPAMQQFASEPTPEIAKTSAPELVFSAGLPPSQSWLSANRYIVGVLLAVGIMVAVVLFLR